MQWAQRAPLLSQGQRCQTIAEGIECSVVSTLLGGQVDFILGTCGLPTWIRIAPDGSQSFAFSVHSCYRSIDSLCAARAIHIHEHAGARPLACNEHGAATRIFPKRLSDRALDEPRHVQRNRSHFSASDVFSRFTSLLRQCRSTLIRPGLRQPIRALIPRKTRRALHLSANLLPSSRWFALRPFCDGGHPLIGGGDEKKLRLR